MEVCARALKLDCPQFKSTRDNVQQSLQSNSSPLFHPNLKDLVVGAVRTNAKEFSQQYHAGIPLEENATPEVLLLYNHPPSLPHSTNQNDIPLLSPTNATASCDLMYAVYVQKPKIHVRQCLALVPHHDDGAIFAQAFRRTQINAQTKQRTISTTKPLRPVGNGFGHDGREWFTPPTHVETQFHYQMIHTYLEHQSEILQKVGGILKRIAKDHTVAALTTNKGYSTLLTNFVCQARARGIDLSHILVFATDAETRQLAEGLGLNAYYEEKVGFSERKPSH